jgi:hypothetical protein
MFSLHFAQIGPLRRWLLLGLREVQTMTAEYPGSAGILASLDRLDAVVFRAK